MELTLTREWKNIECTIGELSVNGSPECFTIEDKERGLTKATPLATIKAVKIHGKTAIPTGRYQVIISFSDRFQRDMPELVNVPGFAGIRIHSGNTAADTEGCLILGQMRSANSVLNSRKAYEAFYPKLKSALDKREKVFITIQ